MYMSSLPLYEGDSLFFLPHLPKNLNIAEQNKCDRFVSCKISLFGKMQRRRFPSFELFQLDMYDFTLTKLTQMLAENNSESHLLPISPIILIV